MRTSDLRRRVTFQSRTASQDSFGQQLLTWSDVLTSVPADIMALTGLKLQTAQAINASLSHQIAVRYHALLADPIKVAAMRVVYVNAGVTRIFNLGPATNVDERNREIQILATEGLNQG